MFATRKRLVAASLPMCDLIIHTGNSDAGNQSRCNLDASVNDALIVFPKSFVTTGIIWHNEAHSHVSGYNGTCRLCDSSFSRMNMTPNLSFQVA